LPGEAVRFLDGAALTPDQRELIAHGNAEPLLGLN
jgi:predicted TIM-barrel fold metal-dependent hydrolase